MYNFNYDLLRSIAVYNQEVRWPLRDGIDVVRRGFELEKIGDGMWRATNIDGLVFESEDDGHTWAKVLLNEGEQE